MAGALALVFGSAAPAWACHKTGTGAMSGPGVSGTVVAACVEVDPHCQVTVAVHGTIPAGTYNVTVLDAVYDPSTNTWNLAEVTLCSFTSGGNGGGCSAGYEPTIICYDASGTAYVRDSAGDLIASGNWTE